jgi:iron complex transport system substrate-binding protein
VVISYNANSIKENLTALHVPVVEQDAPATLSAAYAQIRALGKLTDHRHGAQRLITRIKSALREGIEATQGKGQKLSAYIELDPTLYSVTSSTFLGSIFAKFGVHNIADPESTSADAGYPQLSQEYIITANPTLIVLADTVCCNASAQTIAARPGWTKIAAVKNNNVLALNDTVASTWGSLLPRLIREISHAIIRGSAK